MAPEYIVDLREYIGKDNPNPLVSDISCQVDRLEPNRHMGVLCGATRKIHFLHIKLLTSNCVKFSRVSRYVITQISLVSFGYSFLPLFVSINLVRPTTLPQPFSFS